MVFPERRASIHLCRRPNVIHATCPNLEQQVAHLHTAVSLRALLASPSLPPSQPFGNEPLRVRGFRCGIARSGRGPAAHRGPLGRWGPLYWPLRRCPGRIWRGPQRVLEGVENRGEGRRAQVQRIDERQAGVDRRAKARVDLGGEQVDMLLPPQNRFQPKSCSLEVVVMLFVMTERKTEREGWGSEFFPSRLFFFGFCFNKLPSSKDFSVTMCIRTASSCSSDIV